MMWQNSIHSFQNGCMEFYELTHDWDTLRFLENPNTIILRRLWFNDQGCGCSIDGKQFINKKINEELLLIIVKEKNQ